ncbi:MAG TPA: LysR family transcriptional regulator [Streptosporangiaceae bacterium]|jgi:DNA-binding transcriptional LysR family regulator
MADDLDLNLLRVFDALMDTGSVAQAAVRLHLSAPATSRALGRLRRAMNDPILVRAGQGLVPTPFAQRSAARVKALLDAAAELQAGTAGHDPRSWQRTFSIRLNDALIPVLAPRLTRRVTADAPEVRLRFAAQDSKEPDLLRDGTLDLDIGIAGVQPADIHSSSLLTDHFVAVVAADSELGRAEQLTVDDLCAHPHISASRRGFARGPLDDALEQTGRSRHVAAVVPSYALGGLMVLEGDVICLLPRIMAAHLAERGVPLQLHEVPFDLPAVDVELRWHRRLDNDPASQWLRGCVHDAVQPLIATPGASGS